MLIFKYVMWERLGQQKLRRIKEKSFAYLRKSEKDTIT